MGAALLVGLAFIAFMVFSWRLYYHLLRGDPMWPRPRQPSLQSETLVRALSQGESGVDWWCPHCGHKNPSGHDSGCPNPISLAGEWCPHCGEIAPEKYGHDRRCPDCVHDVQMVVHDSGDWLISSGAYIPPERTYSVRCSCGVKTNKRSYREWAIDEFRDLHSSWTGNDVPVQIVPEVHA
jgi:hypothetical protein